MATATARVLSHVIGFYRQAISPWLAPRCRFVPSCSVYALGVLGEQRLMTALGLIAWRLVRCQPFAAGGPDAPPGPSGSSELAAHADVGQSSQGIKTFRRTGAHG